MAEIILRCKNPGEYENCYRRTLISTEEYEFDSLISGITGARVLHGGILRYISKETVEQIKDLIDEEEKKAKHENDNTKLDKILENQELLLENQKKLLEMIETIYFYGKSKELWE